MTRNDTFFKILFAIEIALLPLVMASYMLMPHWTVGLFIAGILIVKIWLELFKNKDDKVHKIIMLIGNILTVATLVSSLWWRAILILLLAQWLWC